MVLVGVVNYTLPVVSSSSSLLSPHQLWQELDSVDPLASIHVPLHSMHSTSVSLATRNNL